MTDVTAVILAAGEGKRMKSERPKVLHEICGRPLLGHVLATLENLCTDKILVIGHGAAEVEAAFGRSVRYAIQEEQLGTGHAVMQAAPQLSGRGEVMILCGDTPLLSRETLAGLLKEHRRTAAVATVLTAIVPNPFGYGKIIRSVSGALEKIVEEKDASDQEKTIAEINTGTYVFAAEALLDVLKRLSNKNFQGEYYLTDCIALLIDKGLRVSSFCLEDYRHALGVNDRSQLAQAAFLLRQQINQRLMISGVTMVDPATTYVDIDVRVGPDTTLFPNTTLLGSVEVGKGCIIGPNTEIKDSIIGDGVTVRHSVLSGCILADNVTVGPFAQLRPETVLRQGVKVGNFVEIKKSDIGNNCKIPHLSYVGDAQVGSHANLGAGTIVVNYDGQEKHCTVIGEQAFVGCNSNLVAPVTIGKGAFVAAGSTITKDVPPGALSLARAKQVNKDGMAARFIETRKSDDFC
ncbi:MAG: Bifunctional protein GlmU [Dehalococcoidia bacterium]|nr:Bifunctional protein GlmU [Bacillota bacterium]MBT9142257.1 Bifunctional protein GlmU [Bacillota bacterium]